MLRPSTAARWRWYLRGARWNARLSGLRVQQRERKREGFRQLPVTWHAGASLGAAKRPGAPGKMLARVRSEEHTSELQSPCNLVCRLLLEKKKNTKQHTRS